MNDGWKCPVCNRGVAPSQTYCDHGEVDTAPAPDLTGCHCSTREMLECQKSCEHRRNLFEVRL
jgi:hypothetical protein